MNRRRKQYTEQALIKLIDLNNKISSVEMRTELHKQQSKQVLSQMINGSPSATDLDNTATRNHHRRLSLGGNVNVLQNNG